MARPLHGITLVSTETENKTNDDGSPAVQENTTNELAELRNELARMAKEARMKARGASSAVQETLRILEAEATRFAGEVESAKEQGHEEVEQLGESLKARFQSLLDRIALSQHGP